MTTIDAILPQLRDKATQTAQESEKPREFHASRLNWLRASVLGANDGITSTAGLVVGVAAAAPTNVAAIAIAGIAGLLAGAASMAVGEYVSVSTQRDAERAMIESQRRALQLNPASEFDKLVELYRDRGLSEQTARQVASELHTTNALKAHLDAKLHLDPDDLTNPWAAAVSSAISFTIGAIMPLLAVLLPGPDMRIPVTFVAVMVALALTGYVSAHLGGAIRWKAIVRMVAGGVLAMTITYLIGQLLGTHVAG